MKRLCICIVTVCLLALALLLFPRPVSARTLGSTPQLIAALGFSGDIRAGAWIPLQVRLTGGNSDFNGTISVDVPTNDYGNGPPPTQTYKAPINLPAGGQKQVTLYVPYPTSVQGTSQSLTVHLLDGNGHAVVSQVSVVQPLSSNDIFVGVLSDQNRGFGALSAVSPATPLSHVDVATLDATTFPTQAQVLKNFDLLVLDHFTTSSLSHDQLNALQQWVNQGGSLVVAGGPEWSQTVATLPTGLLPVTLSGTTTLAANTSLLPIGGPSRDGSDTPQDAISVPSALVVSTATVQSGATTLLSAGSTPLQVEANRGQGHVFYIAYDPSLTPLTTWNGASSLWSGLLYRALGDRMVSTQTGVSTANALTINNGSIDNTLLELLPNALPAIWLILVLLGAYLLVIGPIRLLIVRRLKKRAWSWRILLSSIVVFSLLSYGLVLMQKGTSVISDTISLVQLGASNGTNTTAHLTTLVGVYVPSQGSFRVHLPGNTLTQPTSNSYAGIGSNGSSSVTTGSDGSDVDLQGVNTWTLHGVSAEQDSQLSGAITSHLAVNDNILSGTVTNTLPYTLKDAYVLIGDQLVHIGTLAAGQSVPVQLTLVDDQAGSNGGQYQQQQLLINQIATDKGLTNYQYTYGGQGVQNEDQRHLSILAMMSGQSQFMMQGCLGKGCAIPSMGVGYVGVTSSMVISSGMSGGFAYYKLSGGGPFGPYGQGGHDPLLLPNAPASLIGWSDQAPAGSTGVTINGARVGGLQETLVQAPLSVDFSQGVHIPTRLLHGQIVSANGTNAIQGFAVGIVGLYAMQSGSMTFEYQLPASFAQSQHSMSISEPNNLGQFTGQGVGNGQADANNLQVNIYNWQSGKWESFSFSSYTLALPNIQPYVDATGHLLVQLAVPTSNQQNTNSGISFITPQVQIQG